ncbi:MAG: hypothetical protein AAGE52_27420 [Myxococcota bacterium]
MRRIPLLVLAPLFLHGCFLDHGRGADPSDRVEASILAASLSECGLDAGAPDPEADERGDGRIGDCATLCCGGPSRAIILFDVLTMADPIDVEILDVALLGERGNHLASLTANNPLAWAEEYGAWDETLTTLGELQTSYDLSRIDWAEIGGGSPWETYDMTFFLEITVRIGDEVVVLRSTELMREPEFAT